MPVGFNHITVYGLPTSHAANHELNCIFPVITPPWSANPKEEHRPKMGSALKRGFGLYFFKTETLSEEFQSIV